MIGVHIIAEWLAAFIESILYFKIVSVIFETQFSKKKQIKFGLFLSAFIAIGIVMLNMVDLSISLPTLGYAAISYTLGGKILYRGRFSEFLFIAIGYVAFLTGMDMGTVFLMTKLGMTSVIEIVLSNFGIERIIFIVFIKLVECLFVCLFCVIIKKGAEKKNKSGITITVICLVVGSIGGVYRIVSSQILLGIRLDFLQMLLGISGVLLAGVVYLFLRMRENRKEQEYIEQKNHFLEQNYLVAKESYESNAKLYHDMWNHFLLIQKYLEKGQIAEAQKYLLKLIGNHTEYMIEVRTGIEAVDYILSQKEKWASEKGIDMSIHAEYPKNCRIDPVDLCTILTNLLDNAIEACERCSPEIERKIKLTIRRIHQFIIIKIENSSSTTPTIRNEKMMTTKINKSMHGWGIQNVRAAVEKYHGVMEYDYKNNIFTMNVMLFYE